MPLESFAEEIALFVLLFPVIFCFSFWVVLFVVGFLLVFLCSLSMLEQRTCVIAIGRTDQTQVVVLCCVLNSLLDWKLVG